MALYAARYHSVVISDRGGCFFVACYGVGGIGEGGSVLTGSGGGGGYVGALCAWALSMCCCPNRYGDSVSARARNRRIPNTALKICLFVRFFCVCSCLRYLINLFIVKK